MKAVFALLVSAIAVALAQEELECVSVNPIRNFKYPAFQGRWYEIGHYRNSGPLIWAEDNFCSTMNVTADDLGEEEGDSVLTYTTNLEDPEGFLQAFETTLLDMRPPGQWKQVVIPSPIYEPHDFTVLELTDDYAMTYRCGDYDLDISYTVQLLSRKPTMTEAVENRLKAKVTELKLNVDNAEYVRIPHGNCTYVDH